MPTVPTVDAYVDSLIAAAPPLSEAQRDSLRHLLASHREAAR